MGNVAVLGAGSWGTALAVHLAKRGHAVRLWARRPEFADELARARVNTTYLPGIPFPEALMVRADPDDVLSDAALILCAVPSHAMRSTLQRVAPFVGRDAIVVSATKGLERDTHLRMSEVLVQELPRAGAIAVLSGPSFATEVARELPTALVVGSTDDVAVRFVQQELRGRLFRLYGSRDVVGIELGGALKNVIAIAAGVVEALALGHNSLAALITRGLAEMSRLALAMGGRQETLAGLSGLGDLVLTCTGALSRNRHVGIELGRGRRLADILGEMSMVAEGVHTTGAALALGRQCEVELPIIEQMNEVLEGRRTPREALEYLMLRPQRAEFECRPS